MEFEHTPVLFEECMNALKIRRGGTYVDGTLGGGGHSYGICNLIGQEGRLIGFDRDQDAIEASGIRLKAFADRVTVIHSSFENIGDEQDKRGISSVDGILLDLGVSSHQLDDATRGFSYRFDAPLDMRMDRRSGCTAADIVNNFPRDELYRIIRNYGEERYAGRIADRICSQRAEKPITTTGDLVEIIKKAMPAKAKREMGHPAKRTFQALRIEVNAELEILEKIIDQMIGLLSDGGRLCIITFHSLEDRIVKNAFRRNEKPCICPPEFPMCVCGRKPTGIVVTRKAIVPGNAELDRNARSHSAGLRVFERRFDIA